MNRKKLVALIMVLALAFTTLVGGTLAYFSDEDYAENVMVMGNVEIEQHEKDKEGNDFVQNQDLFPMVDTREEGDPTVVDGFFSEKMNNVIDKVVTVENNGDYPAYVRTILAFETARHYAEGSSTEFTDMHHTYIGVLGDFEYTTEYITIGGVEYVLAVCVYEAPLAAGTTSEPSLKQFFLAPTANNEVTDIFGTEYNILALSQAVQTEGFADAASALDTAFGVVNAENATVWFNEYVPRE